MAIATQLGSFGIPQRPEDLYRNAYTSDPEAIRNSREGYANQRAVANIQNLGEKNKMARWNTVFPWMQSQFGNLMGQFNSSSSGIGFPATNINTNPIYSNDMIQKQVNQGIGQNNMAMAAQQQQLGQNMAGRGFGSNSPLQQALMTQLQMGNNAQNQQIRTNLPFQFAKDNAAHVLSAQQLAEQQRSNMSGEQIERNRVLTGLMSPLVSLLGGAF